MQSWKHWQESLESNGHFIHLVSFLSWNGSIKREECESLLFFLHSRDFLLYLEINLQSSVDCCACLNEMKMEMGKKSKTFNPLFGSSSIYAQIVVPHVVSLNDTHPSQEGVQVTSTICFLHNWAKSQAEIWTFYSIRKPATELTTLFEK